jgi:hypothetical protein
MTATDTLLAKTQELVVNGRYVIVDKTTGKPTRYTRATNFAKLLSDTYSLETYGKRMVALGLVLRHDLFVSVASCTPDQKQQLNDLCFRANQAARGDEGSNWGTAAHQFTERIERGDTNITVPAPLNPDDPDMRADLAAYTAAMSTLGGKAVELEQVVVIPDIGVAGKFDQIRTAPSEPLPFIADLKTGGYLDHLSIAVFAGRHHLRPGQPNTPADACRVARQGAGYPSAPRCRDLRPVLG